MKRDYRDYLQDILEAIRDIADFTAGMDFDAFARDKKTINAVVRSIEVIGEAAKRIPKSLQDRYASVPWKKMISMRNKLIHEYFGIDLEILWKVVTEEAPSLREPIETMLRSLDSFRS